AAVQDQIRQDVIDKHETNVSCAPFCADLAEDRFVFPTEETNAQTIPYKQLEEEEEQVWNDLFQQVVQG
ncbi:MAG TPA: hypothetical protein VFZ45_02910, partial [Actinomycetota bacterium]|nr:hypothetical protein [Actinomycetota bacterium]